MAPIEHAVINPRSRKFKTKDIVSKEPQRARRCPFIFTPHFQLYPTGFTGDLFPSSTSASECCIDRSESAAPPECKQSHLLAQMSRCPVYLAGFKILLSISVTGLQRAILRPRPTPPQTQPDNRQIFRPGTFRRSSSTECVTVCKAIPGMDVCERDSAWSPTFRHGSEKRMAHLPPMMRNIPLR